MNGLVLVDKPSGWTSFDAVNYVRKTVANVEGKKPKHVKVGHTGTLDPLATGLLVLLIGSYTKRAPELTKLDKTYEVTMKLGETSTTGDAEGVIASYRHSEFASGSIAEMAKHVRHNEPTELAVKAAFQKFTGEIQQTPPAYSAVKVNGQRAYALARAGKVVEIAPRKVTIHTIDLKAYEFPVVKFIAEVSSGTYIRSLVEDVGKTLDTGAYMSDLRRTKVGQFKLADAIGVETISPEVLASHLQQLT